MKIGICTNIANIQTADAFVYDYIEYVMTNIADMDNRVFDELLQDVKKYTIKTDVCCVFFPRSMKITGDDVDFSEITAYVDHALKRASKLNTQIIVIGSGGARNVPERFDHRIAVQQLQKVVGYIGKVAAQYGMQVAFEHLNKDECNIINSLREAYDFVSDIDEDNIGIVADYYHMIKENEDIQSLVSMHDKIIHAHIAQDTNRSYINQADEDCQVFIDLLRKTNASTRISIEARGDFENEGQLAVEALRKMIQ